MDRRTPVIPHPLFSPAALSAEELEASTVGATPESDRIAARIRDATRTGARAHTLVIGPRGSGKTHVLSLAIARALARPGVAKRVALAWLPEDAIGITTYADLLHAIALALAREDAELGRLRRQGDHIELERRILDTLGDRVLILVLENLHRVFGALGRIGAGALRAFVESSGQVLVLASTPRVFPDVTSRTEPWFGNFIAERVPAWSLADGLDLVRRQAVARGDRALVRYLDTPSAGERLARLEPFTGRSARGWQHLAQVATAASIRNGRPLVHTLLDGIAPYYQGRLWGLPPDQQAIVVALGRGPDRQSVQQIADAAGQDPKVTATTLRRLADRYWVVGSKVAGTDQRVTWYALREPLLRHYLRFRESGLAAIAD